jgi:hypothetical protein
MPKFSLRTLIVVMLLGGPVLAGAWWGREMFFPLLLAILIALGSLLMTVSAALALFAPYVLVNELAYWLRRKSN